MHNLIQGCSKSEESVLNIVGDICQIFLQKAFKSFNATFNLYHKKFFSHASSIS